MGARFEDWVASRAAAETAGEVELRQRFEAAIELGLQFRDARAAHGMSQRELSEASGVRQADVSRIEPAPAIQPKVRCSVSPSH
jgi:ribosome-binding protein aMBF1 (putative translation factor)